MAASSQLLASLDDCITFIDEYDLTLGEVNILCFGDSFTTGYTNDGLDYFPYSERLKKAMSETYGIECVMNLHNVGVNGECISETMHDRLLRILNESDIVFDLIIITGGINDIFRGYSADKIWNNHNRTNKHMDDIDFMESTSSIKEIYELIKEHKQCKDTKVLAVTITPFKTQTNRMNDARVKLNQCIIDYCNNNVGSNHMILCNINEKLSKFSDYWDEDGVHFNKAGYELFADMLFESIKAWLDSKLN